MKKYYILEVIIVSAVIIHALVPACQKKYAHIKNLEYENGQKRYEGELKNKIPDGQGIGYYESGKKRYEGRVKDGKADGQGIFYDENGIKQYEGQFKDDEPVP